MDVSAPYNIYKWYNERRRRWEVRLRQQFVSVKVFHSEKEADDYMQEVRSVMKQPERITKLGKKTEKHRNKKESEFLLDFH